MKKLLISLMLLGSSPLALADDYCNARFDFCVDVPNQLTWLPEAANGDGRQFKLADSDAEILVYGNLDPMIQDDTDKAYVNKMQRQYHANKLVTYERKKDNTYAVSGYDETGNIFYRKIKVKNGVSVTLYFNYAKCDKAKMDAIVTQMAHSLRFY